MSCYEPLQAWRSHVLKTENGKSVIAFKREHVSNLPYEEIMLPCGKCLNCRYDQAKQWAVRCVHEAMMHEESCFLTLTFNNESLNERRHDCTTCEYYKRKIANEDKRCLENPERKRQIVTTCHMASLCRQDFTKFMKRLRKEVSPTKIRYFHVGEYGSKLGRPHHHALLFGWKPNDLVYHSFDPKTNVTLYRSETVERIWKYGFITVGKVNWKTAAYCARYTIKKVYGDEAEKHYQICDRRTGELGTLEREYITMSRRPGIAASWFSRYSGDVFPSDGIHIQGRQFKTPRFYDKLFEAVCPEDFRRIKRKRLKKAKENVTENRYERRRSKRIIAEQRLKLLKREYENEVSRSDDVR